MRCKDSRSGRRFVFNQVEVELLQSNPFSQAPSKEFVVEIKMMNVVRREGKVWQPRIQVLLSRLRNLHAYMYLQHSHHFPE
jgi:hypothetical protein